MSTIFLIWSAILVLVLVVEGVALARGEGTLSEAVWRLRGYTPLRILVLTLWCWLTYHWFIETRAARWHWTDDLVVVLGSALISWLFVRYKRWTTWR